MKLPDKLVIFTIPILLIAIGCAGCSLPTTATTAATTTEPTDLQPIIVPTMPETIPSYLEIDPDTGLHMTGKPTVVDFATYRLKVYGLVDNELSLTYDEIRLLPKLTDSPLLVCQVFFADTATWSGASLKSILELAKVQPGASNINLRSADGYSTGLSLEDALNPDYFLAYELESKTLPVLQGFPLRAVFPGLDGYYWVKWLVEIEVR